MLVERRVETGQVLREANGRCGKIVAVGPSRRDISRDKGFASRNIKVCKDRLAVGGEAFRKADVMELRQMRLCPFQDLFVGEVRDLSLLRIIPAARELPSLLVPQICLDVLPIEARAKVSGKVHLVRRAVDRILSGIPSSREIVKRKYSLDRISEKCKRVATVHELPGILEPKVP